MVETIRVLCLHGMGDNAAIFRAQTAAIRELLPTSYDFTFIEGEELCDPIPGVDQFYPGPYRCWYSSPSIRNVAKAYESVKKAIAEKGTFDVVMGFSQGASLAASLLLDYQVHQPDSPPLFRAAVFFSAPLPFSASLKYGIDSRSCFAIPYPKPLVTARPTKIPAHLIPSDAAYLKPENNESFYQMFHHTADDIRITIPTAHAYGRRDKLWRTHATDLVEMCGGKKAPGVYVHVHDGAHEIPKDEVEEICDIIEMVVAKAGLS